MNDPQETEKLSCVALNGLLYGGDICIPAAVACCPECGGCLFAEAEQWETETGRPTIGGLYVDCEKIMVKPHSYWQSQWQTVINKIEK